MKNEMKTVYFVLFSLLIISSGCSNREAENLKKIGPLSEESQKRVLYIDSYHRELPWVQGITSAICRVFNIKLDDEGNMDNSQSQIELKIFHMDTKRNQSEEFIQKAVEEAKDLIEKWDPHVIIASDDNASKYLISPFYLEDERPFVFCGVNWDATSYGFPTENITGMVEVVLVSQIVDELSRHTEGKRVGFIKGDSPSTRIEGEYFEIILGQEIQKEFVTTYQEWQEKFIALQNQVDILLLGNLGAINDWNQDYRELEIFTQDNTIIPTGTWDYHLKEAVLITFENDPREQGEWAALAALDILNGKAPNQIPVEKNRNTTTYINMALAKKMDIIFAMELFERSHMVNAITPAKKVLYVNSYHEGYVWSDEIEKGLNKAIDRTDLSIELRTIRMDTKNNNSESFIKEAARQVKDEIDHWQPDIVIGSDDNFSKYVIVPYFMDSPIPFVFCGVNWDATAYGFPTSNITGMVEISPMDETIDLMRTISRGDRLGILGMNLYSTQNIITHSKSKLGIEYKEEVLIDNFTQWKQEYLRLQNTVDMLLLTNPVGLEGWDEKEAKTFIYGSTKIPTGITVDRQINYALLGRVKIAEEQGWWAGNAAMDILNGKKIEDIPITTNKESKIILNMPLANSLGIKFPPEMMNEAIIWNEEY